MNTPDLPNTTGARPALALAPCSAFEEIFNSEEYEKFVQSMVSYCHCSEQHRPCDGVLAGGICDNIQEELTYDDDDQ